VVRHGSPTIEVADAFKAVENRRGKAVKKDFSLLRGGGKKGKLKILHVTKIFNLIFPPLW